MTTSAQPSTPSGSAAAPQRRRQITSYKSTTSSPATDRVLAPQLRSNRPNPDAPGIIAPRSRYPVSQLASESVLLQSPRDSVQFKLAILTVLAERPGGRATLDGLRYEVEALTTDADQAT